MRRISFILIYGFLILASVGCTHGIEAQCSVKYSATMRDKLIIPELNRHHIIDYMDFDIDNPEVVTRKDAVVVTLSLKAMNIFDGPELKITLSPCGDRVESFEQVDTERGPQKGDAHHFRTRDR